MSIVGGPDSSPSWSPDGSKIAFSAGSQIWVVNSDGSGQTTLNDPTHTDTNPAWSPDGTLIAFARDTGISTMTPAGLSITSVTTTAGDTQPEWRDAPPVNLSAPTISPTTPPTIGTTLFASVGSWSDSPSSYSYQWFRCNVSGTTCTTSIQGPSSVASYVVAATDVGFPIVVQVSATNIAGTSTPRSRLRPGRPSARPRPS